MHKEGVYSPYDFNSVKLSMHIERYVDKTGSCGFVYENKGSIDGAIFGHMDQHYFGGDDIAVQNGYFVRKSARGGMAAIKLLKSFESWAAQFNPKCIAFSTSNNGKDDRWLKFCESLGYEHVGYVFHKRS